MSWALISTYTFVAAPTRHIGGRNWCLMWVGSGSRLVYAHVDSLIKQSRYHSRVNQAIKRPNFGNQNFWSRSQMEVQGTLRWLLLAYSQSCLYRNIIGHTNILRSLADQPLHTGGRIRVRVRVVKGLARQTISCARLEGEKKKHF